eukprot:gene29184-36192_t
MQLPSLISGKRFTLPRPAGSADAVLLAQLAQREKKAGKLTAIVTSDAADAQRLMDELVFFAPDLRCVLFPDWQPYAEQMLEVLGQEPLLVNTAEGYAPQPEYRPLTKFENRGLRLGHGVWDIVFTRRN